MLSKVRCPGCLTLLAYDAEETHPDEIIEFHALSGVCPRVDPVVLNRALGIRDEDRRRNKRKAAAENAEDAEEEVGVG